MRRLSYRAAYVPHGRESTSWVPMTFSEMKSQKPDLKYSSALYLISERQRAEISQHKQGYTFQRVPHPSPEVTTTSATRITSWDEDTCSSSALEGDTLSSFSNGHGPTVVHGTKARAPVPPVKGILAFSSGHVQIAAPGMSTLFTAP